MSADSPANDDQGTSQAGIDAALARPGATGPPKAESTSAPAAGPSPDASVDPTPSAEKADSPTDPSGSNALQFASEGLSQSEIDAPLAGVTEAASKPFGPSAPTPEPSAPVTDPSSTATPTLASEGLNQADIDAAFRGPAPAGATGGSSTSAEAQATPTDSEERPFDAAAAAMAAAIAEEKAAAAAAANAAPPVETMPLELPDFAAEAADAGARQSIELLHDVNLRVTVELGRTRMAVEDVLKLGDGSIVELDKLAGDPVDVMVNGRLVARGEVLVLNDTFSVRISEVVSARQQALASA